MSDESRLNDLLARTKEQDRVIAELMGSLKRLQMDNEDLKRSRLEIKEVVNVSGNGRVLLMITNIHRTEAGIIVEVSG